MAKYLFLISFISGSKLAFLTKYLKLGILFSTLVRAAVVAKLVILGISSLISFILASRAALIATLVILGILTSMSLRLAL